jgi:putative transposase
VSELAEEVGERSACRLVGVARATTIRHRRPAIVASATRVRSSHRRFSEAERQAIRDVAHTRRFTDLSVREIYATLLDENMYLGSISTMYRVLRAAGETRERRRQATHPARVKPELIATAPGQVWSWDITKLLGPQKWTYFHFYVILDIFSRFIIDWRVEAREVSVLAAEMFDRAIAREGVDPSRLTVHADNGSSMTAKTVAQLFADLGVTKSHSRPHVSNDNAFSEAQFKTLKYGPTFPSYFANVHQAREYARLFVEWYNHHHRHSGIALLTPADVHRGLVDERRSERRVVLHAAWNDHPERFVRGKPEPPKLAPAVYINPPAVAV